MKEITLTCPFTGCSFKALEDADDNVYFTHPLTGDVIKMNFNASIRRYNINRKAFRHIETVSLSEAANLLGVSRQRAGAIAASNVIKPYTVAGQTVFKLQDVLDYKETRRIGAPKKEG